MRRLFFSLTGIVICLGVACRFSMTADQNSTQTVIDTDWCTATAPGIATLNGAFPVTVAYRDIKDRIYLCADLHWLKKDGSYGGFLSWGGPYPQVQGSGSHVFHFRVPAKDGLAAVSMVLYLSPTGQFANRTKEVTSSPVSLDAADIGRKPPTYKGSWIWIDPAAIGKELVSGETWQVPVEYYLAPADDDGNTSLTLWGAGPWIDCPDGKYTTKRFHVGYPGMGGKIAVKPGRGHTVFTFTVPPSKAHNSILLIASFHDGSGRAWPWETRCGPVYFHRASGYFDLTTDVPGNLFTYDEPVILQVKLLNKATDVAGKRMQYTITDTTGKAVDQGQLDLSASKPGATIPLPLHLTRRGTFLIEADVPGWEQRSITFARIPNVLKITGNRPTSFGMTNVIRPGDSNRITNLCRIARRLGLTSCRVFVNWQEIEPGRGEFKLDAWDTPIRIAQENGVKPWFCIVDPPAWALAGKAETVSYRAFRGDIDAWREMVKTVTTRYRGKLLGWEWLNEIVPGDTDTPADDYVRLVEAGTETAKQIDPTMKMLLAGGLWPRSFRQAVLKAGAGKYIDVLPLHYSTGGAMREAQGDLAAVGANNVEVWDDETARGISVWDAPPTIDMTQTLQSDWILTNWADELTAGCRRIVYFGGEGDPAGNWSYLRDDYSPRPVAATMAVFIARLQGAKPLGVFSLGQGGLFHLFERDGKAILLASSYVEGETVSLPVGVQSVDLIDYQGNPTPLSCPDHIARLSLGRMRYYVDGADLDVLKANLVPTIVTRSVAPNAQGQLKDTAVLAGTPKVTMLRGATSTLTVRVQNLYAHPLKGDFHIQLPQGWQAKSSVDFALTSGASQTIPVALGIPATAAMQDYSLDVVFHFADAKLPVITKPMIVSVISPASLGNQLPNGDFEKPAGPGDQTDGWRGEAKRVTSAKLGDGLGKYVLKFTDSRGNWQDCTQTIPLQGGETYLYTAWVWNENMHAGSNLTLHMADGTERRLYDVNVFTCGESSPYWQFYTAHFQAPANTKTVSVTPVTRGSGWALFDNLRITTYEGTDYAADVHRVAQPPVIDGKLDDWDQTDALSLIGKNQLTIIDKGYEWTPENLSGVAYARWDDHNLYLAIKVHDDKEVATQTGDATPDGDSVSIAFDPSNRAADAETKAFVYYVSSASPGGGSGAHTLYRPADHCGGLRSGQLARDSSTYEMAITRDAGITVYELRIPFSELGSISPTLGSKFGFSIQVNDNDGHGPAACMDWGEGLTPVWAPQRFGVATLVK